MKYREAFDRWLRSYLEHQFEKAGCSVSGMAEITGISRQNIYKLCARVGVKVSKRKGRCLPRKEGNAEWNALYDDEAAPRTNQDHMK